MGPSNDIRVALIGFGLGGRVFHAPLIAATPGMRLTSIVTRDPARQRHALERYPDTRIVEQADQLWAPDEHDLVVITTPNISHVPLATAALEAGLAVVIDKPIASTVADAERVVALARERGLVLSVFQNRRWDGDFLTIRRLLAADALGDVVRFESRFERWRPERQADAWRERGDPAEGGGLLLDLGSHLIDQAMVLFGPPVEVYAEVERRRPGVEVDDDTFVALTHANGVRSHLWASVTARLEGPRFRVLGLRGAYEKFGLDGQEAALDQGADPATAARTEPRERWGLLATGEGEQRIETEPGDYLAYYAGVARSMTDGVPPPVDARETVDALRVIEAAAQSAREARVVAMAWNEGAS
jgi:predicted dehydrogenase